MVYSEPALLHFELVIGDIPTNGQFDALRRYCGNYAQVAKAISMERITFGR